jgi:hypothetical protein
LQLVTPCHRQFLIATSMLDQSLPQFHTEFSIYHPIRFHPTLFQILEGDHDVRTLKLEGDEAAYRRLARHHRAAEAERPPGVGSGGLAAAEAEATSRRGSSWRARRAEDKRRRCVEMPKSFAGSGGRRRSGGLRRRRRANPIAIPIARRRTQEKVEWGG